MIIRLRGCSGKVLPGQFVKKCGNNTAPQLLLYWRIGHIPQQAPLSEGNCRDDAPGEAGLHGLRRGAGGGSGRRGGDVVAPPSFAVRRRRARPTTALRRPPRRPAPYFTDMTPGSGLDFTYRNGSEEADNYSILESLGGGVALIDYDQDGLLDVFVPGGGYFAGPRQARDLRLPQPPLQESGRLEIPRCDGRCRPAHGGQVLQQRLRRLRLQQRRLAGPARHRLRPDGPLPQRPRQVHRRHHRDGPRGPRPRPAALEHERRLGRPRRRRLAGPVRVSLRRLVLPSQPALHVQQRPDRRLLAHALRPAARRALLQPGRREVRPADRPRHQGGRRVGGTADGPGRGWQDRHLCGR